MEMIYYNQTWPKSSALTARPRRPMSSRNGLRRAEAMGDGSGGFILRDDASAVAAWTLAFGGDILNEEGTSYVYNSQATIDAMTWLKGMYDDGCAFFFTEATPTPSSPPATPSSLWAPAPHPLLCHRHPDHCRAGRSRPMSGALPRFRTQRLIRSRTSMAETS